MMASQTEAAESPALDELYAGFRREGLVPLWTEIGNLMPTEPHPTTRPHRWSWASLLPLAQSAGELVPVGRGGERRAMALANPGLGGRPFATPTLWAAIQYLGRGEVAPAHRHTQNAFRFVIEGEGVWTVVNGDSVAMRRGDFLPQPGWNWHAHHNSGDGPMTWLDGLDIPFAYYTDTTFFEFGPDQLDQRATPDRCRSERLWAYPGLRPLGEESSGPGTPLLVYRWEATDAALRAQLELESEGASGVYSPGHAAVRYVNPTNGRDVMPTIRAEFHRLADTKAIWSARETGSSVVQVFDGTGTIDVGEQTWRVERGDLVVIPSWQRFRIRPSEPLDLFRFSDAPILEAMHLHRYEAEVQA